jgi:hypothetical protein
LTGGDDPVKNARSHEVPMPLRAAAVLPLLAAVLVAAAPPATAQLIDPYPLDGVLRLNDLQAKGTHNSYHLISPIWNGNPPFDLDYEHAPLDVQLAEQGARKFELDLYWDPAGFRVQHINFVDAASNCPTLVECLSILRDWSLANPWHHPIFVLIEPKGLYSPTMHSDEPITGHYDQLDDEIRSVLEPDGLLITPDEVRGAHATLREAILGDGWPTLRETRGRFLVVMLDTDVDRAQYVDGHPSLAGRAMFVTSSEGRDDAAVMRVDNSITGFATIQRLVALGYVIRSRADVIDDGVADEATRDAAIASGAHYLSTDFPAEGMRADGYWVDLGGRPSRCNPITTAGVACSPLDIEAPAWLRPPVLAFDEPRLRAAFESEVGDPEYDETVDYDGDGRIGYRDLNRLRLAAAPPLACGLVGVELALVAPLVWRRRRRARS